MPESYTHGKNAETGAAVVRYMVADDGPAGGIYDEPDVSFDAADLDIGFISSKDTVGFRGVMIHRGFDIDSCSLTVIGDLLMGDTDVIMSFTSILESICKLP